MRITYIKHSGFLAEWEDAACIFDWAEGDLPPVKQDKKLYIFVSHGHRDHFVPELYERCAYHPRRTFILSEDVRPLPEEGEGVAVIRMKPDMRRVINGGARGALSVTTLPSTDQGVAFVVNYARQTVYHAGDLHWWAWPDDTPAEERQMKNAFFDQLMKIKGLKLDAAFVPLDPRLGGNFWMGFDALMRSCDVKMAFPMHMWGHYEYIEKLRGMSVSAPYRDRIARVETPGQVWGLT